MEQSGDKDQRPKKFSEITTFAVPFSLVENQKNITIITNTPKKSSKEEEIINQALKLHSQGNILDAKKYYEYFINQGFNDYRVFSNYGTILKNLGQLKEAEISIRKAIDLKSDFAEAYSNLGIILKDLEKLQEAEISTRKAIKINPNFTDAHYNLGIILKDLNKLQEAEISYRTAIKLNPNFANAHYNLGNVLRDLGKLQEAEVSYHKAIELKPNSADTYYNLGLILSDLGKLQEAESSYSKVIKLNPNFTNAHYNLGNILKGLGKLQEAEFSYRKAIELNPNFANAHSNLGNILLDLGNLQEAELSSRKAIELKPNFAEAHFNLSLVELIKEKYQSGLENYEFRFKTKKPHTTHCQPQLKRVKNEKLKKEEKLLIVTEQGLGDTLQYMRYVPYLRSQDLDVSFCVQEKLHSLIKASGIDNNPLTPIQANTVSEGKWIPLLSIPRYLKVSPENPIITKPYIHSSDELNQKWKDILSKEKRPIVGINWQGNPEMEKNYQGRSIALEEFSIISYRNDISLLSLQKGFGSEQLEKCSFKNKFVQCQQQIDSAWDFLENAAIIENCDLIITCDTSIAHLAGGMGKKVWLLLRNIPYWTWGLDRESTFWYPSMRLFRQKERHNWQGVMERVSSQINIEI